MKYLVLAAALSLMATVSIGADVASAQGATCKAQATGKKLAGAAEKSFMTKCQNDAKAACDKSAADKKLAGAAKTSHVKKCLSDAVGS
jgi:hypothetical protein